MGSGESYDLLVVEAHAVEDFSESGGTEEGTGDMILREIKGVQMLR
jgi:hypothetical protein